MILYTRLNNNCAVSSAMDDFLIHCIPILTKANVNKNIYIREDYTVNESVLCNPPIVSPHNSHSLSSCCQHGGRVTINSPAQYIYDGKTTTVASESL